MKTARETILQELERRQKRERTKAISKYGAQASAPGGDPSRDVLDYTLGELAGLDRYAEMIGERFSSAEGRRLAKSIKQFSELVAVDLILFRRKQMARGVELGASEYGD